MRQEIGDKFGMTGSLDALGHLSLAIGDLEKAAKYFQESLKLSKDHHIGMYIASALDGLGTIARLGGEYEQAEQLNQESLAFRKTEGSDPGVAVSLNHLGQVAFDQENYEHAERFHEESRIILIKIGHKPRLAFALCRLGHTATAKGEHAKALDYFQQAIGFAKETQVAPTVLDVLVGWAALLMRKHPDDQGRAQTVELLALVHAHPASTSETRQKVGRLLVECSPRMAPDDVEMAKAKSGYIKVDRCRKTYTIVHDSQNNILTAGFQPNSLGIRIGNSHPLGAHISRHCPNKLFHSHKPGEVRIQIL
jgi:tetratricopeptide (TPR) repeat protein